MEILKKYYKKRHEAVRYGEWLIHFVRPWLMQMIIISLLNSLVSVMGVGIAAINKRVVDEATGTQPDFHFPLFLLLVGITLFNIAFSNGTGVLRTWLYERFGFSLKEEIYSRLMEIQWLPLTKLHSGDIMTRMTGDIDVIASGMFEMLPSTVSVIIQLITAFALLYHYDSILAVFALFFGPAGMLFGVFMGRILAKFQKQARENESRYRAFMQESMENLVVTKSFCMEKQNKNRMTDFWTRRMQIIKRQSLAGFALGTVTGGIFSGGYLIAFGWSLMRLTQGEITYGTVTLLLTLVGQVQTPIMGMQSLLQQMVGVLVSAGRIMEIWEMPQESELQPMNKNEQQEEELQEMMHHAIGLRGRDVTFFYDKTKQTVFKHLNFDFVPGRIYGIIGRSGAGKTTLVRMLLSLIYPQEGEICLYDRRGKEYCLQKEFRSLISYVPQGNTLMSGTIRENMLAGNPCASQYEIRRALECACALEFVQELPQGLDAVLLEKGGTISEGQAQRIAIARAIIKPSVILILDEATASLDMETEQQIVRNLQSKFRNKTCLIITHRPTLLQICDETFCLEDGVLSAISHDIIAKKYDVDEKSREYI